MSSKLNNVPVEGIHHQTIIHCLKTQIPIILYIIRYAAFYMITIYWNWYQNIANYVLRKIIGI
jgi:hypothetical protein